MKTKELEVFHINELPDRVRDKILDKYRENMDFDYDYIWDNFQERAEKKGIIINRKSLTFDLYRNDLDFEYSIDMDKIVAEYFPTESLALKMLEDDDEYDEIYEKVREDCEEEALTIASQLKKELLDELKEAYDLDTSDETIIQYFNDDDALFLEDGHRVE